jgi:hypothetical protein
MILPIMTNVQSWRPVKDEQASPVTQILECGIMLRQWTLGLLAGWAIAGFATRQCVAQRPVVPGTGRVITGVGDDFEDPNWSYVPNDPKSTEDIDENQRTPTGKTRNGRWYEGIKRGHPDIVRRVPTPPGGLAGSEGAMLLKSKFTGIPGRPSRRMHQDDFVANVQYRLGRRISVSEVPSVTTRVFLPPVAEWEHRNGPHFGFRLALETTALVEEEGFLGIARRKMDNEVYWPGMFIEFRSKAVTKEEHDYASIRIRGNRRGGDFTGPQITTTGWWTLGMSVTPDGMVHYYASPGIDDLTEEDYITSQFPYGYRAERFRTFFYNVCSADDGHRWSTEWVIDDPQVFLARPQVARKKRR